MLASRVLLNYLFKETEWLLFLHQVSQIAFVCTEPLQKLSCIVPAYSSENKIQKGNKTINLTSLCDAALNKHARKLGIWTVEPLVKLPTFHLMATKKIEEFHQRLGVCTSPKIFIEYLSFHTSICSMTMSTSETFRNCLTQHFTIVNWKMKVLDKKKAYCTIKDTTYF